MKQQVKFMGVKDVLNPKEKERAKLVEKGKLKDKARVKTDAKAAKSLREEHPNKTRKGKKDPAEPKIVRAQRYPARVHHNNPGSFLRWTHESARQQAQTIFFIGRKTKEVEKIIKNEDGSDYTVFKRDTPLSETLYAEWMDQAPTKGYDYRIFREFVGLRLLGTGVSPKRLWRVLRYSYRAEVKVSLKEAWNYIDCLLFSRKVLKGALLKKGRNIQPWEIQDLDLEHLHLEISKITCSAKDRRKVPVLV